MLYIVFALSSLAVNYNCLRPTSLLDDIESLLAFVSLGLACVCFVITQIYTYCFEGTLFPRNVGTDHINQETYCAESDRREKDCRGSQNKNNDIEMFIVNKQIMPESEEGKAFIPREWV